MSACTLKITDHSVDSTLSRDAPYHHDHSGWFPPLMLHNIAGTERTRGTSIENAVEVFHIVSLVDAFKKRYPKYFSNIGIIAAYRSQRIALIEALRSRFGSLSRNEIEVSTVDGFQGREKNIIIFSCVRSAIQT